MYTSTGVWALVIPLGCSVAVERLDDLCHNA